MNNHDLEADKHGAAKATSTDNSRSPMSTGIFGNLRKRLLGRFRVQLLAPRDPAGVPETLNRWLQPCHAVRWAEAFDDYTRFRWDRYRERGLLDGYPSTLEAGLYPHDRFSWVFLIRDVNGAVAGAISVRTLNIRPNLNQLAAGSLFQLFTVKDREHCELSVVRFIERSLQKCGLFCEVSNWAVPHDEQGDGIGALLAFASGALGLVGGLHRCLTTANVKTKAYSVLVGMGCRPLQGENGFEIAAMEHPFYRSRLGLLDGSSFDWHPRYGVNLESASDFLDECEVIAFHSLSDSPNGTTKQSATTIRIPNL